MTKSDIGPFAIVPEWVLRSGISSSALSVYVVLSLHADRETDEAWPSRQRIAEIIGRSTRQVSTLIRELEVVGAVRTDLEARAGSSSIYTVVYAKPLKSSDIPLKSTAPGVEADRKAPLEVDFKQNQNHLEPESRTNIAPAEKTRPRDEVWDALVAIYGHPTGSGSGSMNAAAKTLRDYQAAPEEIEWMARTLGKTVLSWAVVTPTALAKHFGERQALVAQLDKKPYDRAAAIAKGDLDG